MQTASDPLIADRGYSQIITNRNQTITHNFFFLIPHIYEKHCNTISITNMVSQPDTPEGIAHLEEIAQESLNVLHTMMDANRHISPAPSSHSTNPELVTEEEAAVADVVLP